MLRVKQQVLKIEWIGCLSATMVSTIRMERDNLSQSVIHSSTKPALEQILSVEGEPGQEKRRTSCYFYSY